MARYRSCYGAVISHFPQKLIAAISPTGEVKAACGLRDSDETFISARYFDDDLTQRIAKRLNRPVDASQIVEFTTLAADGLDSLYAIFGAARDHARRANKITSVFTTTKLVSRILTRWHVRLIDLGSASIARAPDADSWGHYYNDDTRVFMLPDEAYFAGDLFCDNPTLDQCSNH